VRPAFERLTEGGAIRGWGHTGVGHPRALHDVLPELATVVLGVENRAELEECPAAEAAGPLSDDELRAIAAAGRGASARRPAGERRLATQQFHPAAERNPSWVFSYERIG
jgi:hypothetical protein